jgi:predicted RNA-binding protein with PIN domain
MAIHIIVDGYNLIGSEKGLHGKLENHRKRLLERLQQYHEIRGYPITVVFDGWRSGWIHEVEEKAGDLAVIFSRQGEKADSVIQRMASEMGSACVVVTSDREVRRSVEASGATAIYAREFERKLAEAGTTLAPSQKPDQSQMHGKRGNPKRLPKHERKRKERLKRL